MNARYRDPGDLRQARRLMRHALGDVALAELHAENRWLDGLAMLLLWLAFAVFFWVLAASSSRVLWWSAVVGQGIVLQMLGLYTHDALVHRRVWGLRASRIAAMACMFPVFYRPADYEFSHFRHHRYLGTEHDTEDFKQDLNSRLKRLAFLTLVGTKLAHFRVFRLSTLPVAAEPPRNEALAGQLRVETRALFGFVAALLAATVLWPSAMWNGYLLPLCIVTPFVSSIRTILEHADANPGNPFHVATFYRTGWISRLVFLWDSGDCHLVHHLYSGIPFYRMGHALKLMRPVLLANGVYERRSLRTLLEGWFVRVHTHRTLWFAD